MKKRILSLLLCLCMAATLLPATALAAGPVVLDVSDVPEGKSIVIADGNYSVVDHNVSVQDGENAPPVEGTFTDLVLTGTGEGFVIIVENLPEGGSLTLRDLTVRKTSLMVSPNEKPSEPIEINVEGKLSLSGTGHENLLIGDVSFQADGGNIALDNSGAPVWDANGQEGGSLCIADAGDVNISGGGNDTCVLWGSASSVNPTAEGDDTPEGEPSGSVVGIQAGGTVTIHNEGLAPAITNVIGVTINADGNVAITNTPGEESSVARSLTQWEAVGSNKLFITSGGKVTINGILDYMGSPAFDDNELTGNITLDDVAAALKKCFSINAVSGVDLTMRDVSYPQTLCVHHKAITSDGSIIFREPDWDEPGDGMILMKDGKPNILLLEPVDLAYPDDAAMLKDIPVWMAGDGTVEFDLSNESAPKVTLNNATLDNASIPAVARGDSVFDLSSDRVTLALVGNNTVKYSMAGIDDPNDTPPALALGGNVTITGSGSLTVKGGLAAIEVAGSLTVENGTVTAEGAYVGIVSSGLTINGGTVTASVGDYGAINVTDTLKVAETAELDAEVIGYLPSKDAGKDNLQISGVNTIVITRESGAGEEVDPAIAATVYGTVEMSDEAADALKTMQGESPALNVTVPEGATLVLSEAAAETLLGGESNTTKITNNGALIIPDKYIEDNDNSPVTSGDDAKLNPCMVKVSADPAAGGTVAGGGVYDVDSSVTVTATANSGYVFSKWTEKDAEVSTSASYTFTAQGGLAGMRDLTAVFTRQSSGGGSSGGGGGSSSSSGTTTKNPDGSTTTTTEDKKTGTVTETTKNTDGSQTVVETKKDGTVTTTETDKTGNKTETVAKPDGSSETKVEQKDGTTATMTTDVEGKTEAKVELSEKAVSEAQKEDKPVALPIPEVKSSSSAETAPVVTVTTGSKDAVKVEIPVEDTKPGTVAVIVKEDGTEEIIKTTIPTEKGVAVELPDGATVKIVDNSKSFEDVPATSWAADAVAFSSARELFAGTSETTFSPEAPMTRAMLVTVLARFDGVDTSGGDTWYQKGVDWAVSSGVSDGSAPDSNITREQLVAMLWRYAGSPAPSKTLDEFTDAGAVSGYAQDAMRWAVENGIVSGMGDNTLAPQGSATRAQVASILQRFVTK